MKNLATLRKEHGLSQQKLASDIGLARNTICQYESGNRVPDVSTLVLLADYFGVSTDYLLGREEKKSVIERPTSEIAENFIREFKEQMKEKAFQDIIAKLYKAIDLQEDRVSMKAQILTVLVTYLKGVGMDTQAIVGY